MPTTQADAIVQGRIHGSLIPPEHRNPSFHNLQDYDSNLTGSWSDPGMLGGEDLALPYSWIMRNLITVSGQWMYPREVIHDCIALVRSGLLQLEQFALAEFAIEDIDRAIEHASGHAGAFNLTVVRL
ncbi:hypothetical protein [Paraburkholderia tropica]|uniref:hypothetical protein n=1 Tax=Paraburkholderia tropica TaxID=92647 RepID=UPI003D2CC3C9